MKRDLNPGPRALALLLIDSPLPSDPFIIFLRERSQTRLTTSTSTSTTAAAAAAAEVKRSFEEAVNYIARGRKWLNRTGNVGRPSDRGCLAEEVGGGSNPARPLLQLDVTPELDEAVQVAFFGAVLGPFNHQNYKCKRYLADYSELLTLHK